MPLETAAGVAPEVHRPTAIPAGKRPSHDTETPLRKWARLPQSAKCNRLQQGTVGPTARTELVRLITCRQHQLTRKGGMRFVSATHTGHRLIRAQETCVQLRSRALG